MAKRILSEKSIEAADVLNRTQKRVLKELTRNTPSSITLLLNVLGLGAFRGDKAPDGYRKSGNLLIDKKTGDKITVFSIGELKHSHWNSLTNLFRLSLLVTTNPSEDTNFYVHNLRRQRHTQQKPCSYDFVKNHLEAFKEKRLDLIRKKIILTPRSNSRYIRNAIKLLVHLMVCPSTEHPFTPVPNFKELNALIHEAKKS